MGVYVAILAYMRHVVGLMWAHLVGNSSPVLALDSG
nr:MAG TPA: hypothetical protein [Bacteriophage sp.]